MEAVGMSTAQAGMMVVAAEGGGREQCGGWGEPSNSTGSIHAGGSSGIVSAEDPHPPTLLGR